MSIEDNKALVRRAYELTNRRELATFFELLAPEYVEHLPTGDKTREQVKDYADIFFNAFPDVRFKIVDMVAEGDKVAVLVNWRGTHKGVFMNILPTGNNIDITNANMIKIAGEKWVEFWNITDVRLMQQLGVIPQQGER
ncbi:MAG TPA: ester cyclase [Dehalococcoidia bacterium]|nr:ester cyclase [Dehalococcoidia bacterium]